MPSACPRLARLVSLTLVCLLMTSCSDNMAEVSGTVTLDGSAVESGSMTFVPIDGSTATAGCSIANGKYSARVPIGKMSVSITVPKVIGKKKLYNTPDSPEGNLYAESLPARYNAKTELELEVKSGKNTKDWALDGK